MEHKQIKKRIQRMTSGQPVYPALLKEIRDYPKELYYIGDPKLLEEKCVSIVGSRKTNQYGRSTALSLIHISMVLTAASNTGILPESISSMNSSAVKVKYVR